jgi:hypothetical protein
MLTASNVAETDYSAWASDTTYTAAQRCIVTTGVHEIYESLAGGNLNHDPVTDLASPPDPTKSNIGTYWKRVSATNRWKCFDNKVGSQTAQATSITYQITPGEVFDSIAFINLDAVTVRIKLTDPSDGVVYDQTVDLQTTVITGTTTVMDWYTYFFSSIVKITDFVKFDIPPYLNGVLDITITYTGGAAKVGGIIPGLQTNFGTVMADPKPSFGTRDYSKKTADDYGVYSIIPGPFSKWLNCTVMTPNVSIDEVERVLALYRSTPIVIVGSETIASMIMFGIIKDHTASAGLNYSFIVIEIEGLT